MRSHLRTHSTDAEPQPIKKRRHSSRLAAIVAVPLLAIQALFLLMGAAAAPAHAASTGSISGVVRTISGQPVPNAVVLFFHDGFANSTVTAANGSYTRDSLPFDDYTIQVKENCFSNTSIPLTVDGAEKKDVVLAFARDAFGHVCRKAAIDSSTNSTLSLKGDDAVASVQIPFGFPYYGGVKHTAFISTNGFLTFTAPTPGAHAFDLPLLDPDTPADGIFPFWDDLIVDASASIRLGFSGTAPNRVAVFEWSNVTFLASPTTRVSFKVTLFESGRIGMNWDTKEATPLQRGLSATVGIRNGVPGQAFDALQVSQDEPRVKLAPNESLEFLTNHAPVAKAGADKTVASGASFTLDGSGSTDQDGTSGLTFQWVQSAGPATTLQDPKKAKTSVTGVKGPATLTYQLTVLDPFGRASIDSVTVTVSKPK